MAPPNVQDSAASGYGEWLKPQVHAAPTTTQSIKMPALFTVPWMVIVAPDASSPENALSLRTGLFDRKGFAMKVTSEAEELWYR